MNKKDKIGIGIVLFLLIFLIDYHCPFLSITGIPCPGCGMTRSLLAFLKGDLYSSFQYHPMLIPTGICALFYIFNKKYRNIILIIWCCLMMLCYGYRMIFLGFEYSWDSLFGRLLLLFQQI